MVPVKANPSESLVGSKDFKGQIMILRQQDSDSDIWQTWANKANTGQLGEWDVHRFVLRLTQGLYLNTKWLTPGAQGT